MSAIHPTASIHPAARIGAEVQIGPWSILGPDLEICDRVVIGSHTSIGVPDDAVPPGHVTIGADSKICPQAVIIGQVSIGRNARIGRGAHLVGPLKIGSATSVFDHAVIGNPGQYPGHHKSGGLVEIGSDVVLREQVCVTRPVSTELTAIGDGSYLMARTQIDHDCRLGRGVKTASGVTLGGNVVVGDFAYLGMNAVVHQGARVGPHTMVGMNTAVIGDIPPYAVFFDRRVQRVNVRGLKLRGLAEADIAAIVDAFETLDAHQAIERLDQDNPWVAELHAFLQQGAPAGLRAFRRTSPSNGKAAR